MPDYIWINENTINNERRDDELLFTFRKTPVDVPEVLDYSSGEMVYAEYDNATDVSGELGVNPRTYDIKAKFVINYQGIDYNCLSLRFTVDGDLYNYFAEHSIVYQEEDIHDTKEPA